MRFFLDRAKTKVNLTAVTASILLIGVIVFLVTANFISHSKLRKFTLEQIRFDIEKRAASISYFCSERNNDLTDLASSREISAFFENKALGMSMEYGLKASLIGISESFERLLAERKINDDRIYTGMVFIDNNGKLLVESYLEYFKLWQEPDWKKLLTPESSGAAITLKHDGPVTSIMVSTPYFFKDEYAGQIVAWIYPPAIYHFVEVMKEFSKRSIYIVCTEHYMPLHVDIQTLVLFSSLSDFDDLGSGTTHRFKAKQEGGNKIDIVAIKTKVQDTPFSIIALLPASELYGKLSPWYLPLAMGILAIILLGGIGVTFRISMQNMILHARLEESSKREQEIEEKRCQLEKEITERELAEDALRKTHEKLEVRVKERTVELAKANEELQREIAERKRAAEELKQSEKLFKDISYSMADWIWEVDNDGKYTFASEPVKQILGYNPEEIIGKTPFDLMPEDEAKHMKEAFKIICSEKKPIVDMENWNLTKDGRKVCLLTNGVPILDKSGRLIGYRGVDKNITDRKLADEEKQRLEIQLQHARKMEAIGTLAGGVAHDLNNILTSLVGYPELLLMDIPQNSHLREPLLTIKKSGGKAAAIVQDLLTLARRGVAIKEVVNLNHVISEYLKSPEYEKLRLFHPDVRFKTEFEIDLLNIKGSSVHLSKTVMNLVSNAAEAMPGGGEISITTENQYIDTLISGYENIVEGDYAMLTVSDTGIGISPEDIERIFEPFYTKKVMAKSGTGLGMSVVWGTVKDHRGYIDVQSAEGEGTSFKLYFPVSRDESTTDKSPISREDYMGRGESILIVDDVEEQRELLSEMLNRLGYSTASIASGEKAVDYMRNHSMDLLVLDMIMDPGIDGLETYKKILELHPGQKAIIASGFSETDRVKEALRLGAGAYVKKPYLLETIGLTIRAELDK